MINVYRKTILVFSLFIALFGLSACSTVDKLTAKLNEKPTANYQNNKSVKSLEVPPDLTTPEFDDAFALPNGVVSAVSLENGEYRRSTRSLANYTISDGPSSVLSISGQTVLRVNSTYPKSLVSTEAALKKLKFTTVSKSPSGDVITAKYTGKDVLLSNSTATSMFSHIVIGGKRKRLLKFNGALERESVYLVSIKNERGASIVRFARADKEEISDEAHAKIIELLDSAFKS